MRRIDATDARQIEVPVGKRAIVAITPVIIELEFPGDRHRKRVVPGDADIGVREREIALRQSNLFAEQLVAQCGDVLATIDALFQFFPRLLRCRLGMSSTE